jgi:hypothetical protein
MGEMFAKDRERYSAQADEIVNQALERIKHGEAAAKVIPETIQVLQELQDHVNRSWKGHGPDVITRAGERLEVF